ncbi:MAG: hypothetical protein WCL11_08515 [Verrucomicrobiota bacterium]
MKAETFAWTKEWTDATKQKAKALYEQEVQKLKEAQCKEVRVAILGCEASGKTVFIAAMAHQFQERGKHRFFLECGNRTAINFLGRTWRILASGDWPPPTNMNQLHTAEFVLHDSQSENRHQVMVLDFAGEYYRAVFGDDEPNLEGTVSRQLWDFACKADITLILISLDDFIDSAPHERLEQNEFAPKKIADLAKARGAVFAVVFSKADRFKAELQKHNNNWKTVFAAFLPATHGAHPDAPVFAVSSVNKTIADHGREIPGPDFDSEGYDKLLEWTVDEANKIARHRGRRLWIVKAKIALVVGVLLLMLLRMVTWEMFTSIRPAP